jgi:hypothetical protein
MFIVSLFDDELVCDLYEVICLICLYDGAVLHLDALFKIFLTQICLINNYLFLISDTIVYVDF